MKSKLIFYLLIICLLVSSLGIVSAFTLIFPDNTKASWENKSFENPVWVNVTNYSAMADLGVPIQWQGAVRKAIEDINNQSNETGSFADFAFVEQYQIEEDEIIMSAEYYFDVDIETGRNNAPLGWMTPVNEYRTSESRGIDEPDIWVSYTRQAVIVINTAYNWSLVDPPSNIRAGFHDLRSVVGHELGHAAGLAHFEADNSSMKSTFAEQERRYWSADDVNGLIAIYGDREGTSVETPDEGGGLPNNNEISAQLNDIRGSAVVTGGDTTSIKEKITITEYITTQISKLKNWWG